MMTDRDRTAGTPASHAAMDYSRLPSDDERRARRGRAWFGAWVGLSAGYWHGLRTVLPGLLALLLVAGWTPEAGAQSPTYSISPTEIYEGERLTFTVTTTDTSASRYTVLTNFGFGRPDYSATYADDYLLYGVGETNPAARNSNGTYSIRNVPLSNGMFRFELQAIADNDASEGDETLYIDLSDSDDTYNNSAVNNFRITLKDGARPASGDGVTVSPTTLALTELGSSSTVEKTYTVVLDTDPGADVTITATNGDTSAVEVDTNAGTTGNQSTLTFTHGNSGNWSTAQTVTVRALNDADAAAESFNITHAATAASGAYNGITVNPVAVTTADAGHGVVVSKSSLSVAANDETDTYMVVLKSRPGGTVTITPTSGATARATVSPGTLSFNNSDWNTPKTFTVTGKGAGSTSISHAVSTGTTDYPMSLTIPAVSVTVTAVARTVQILGGPFSAYEGQSVSIPVTLSGTRSVATTVELEQAGPGTATAGTDFAAGPWSVTIPAGQTTANASIAFTDDTALEMDEAFTVRIRESSLPAGVTAGTTRTSRVDILDNEYSLCFDRNAFAVNEHAGEVDLTLTMSRTIPNDVSVHFDYADRTAVSGTDYDEVWASSSDTTTIAAGDRTLTLTVPIHPDLDSTSNKSFDVTAQPSEIPSGQAACSTQVIITSTGLVITETGGDTAVTEDGSDTDTYTIALENQPDSDVTVTVTAGAQVNRAGGTAGSTQTLTFGRSGANIWSTAQTVTVTGVDDSVVNQGGSRTVKIAHAASSSDADYVIGDAGEVSVTVADDGADGAVPVLSVALPSVEGLSRNTAGQLVFVETGTDSTSVGFDVTLTPAPSADFTACIRVTETGGGAAPGRVAAGDEGVKAVTVSSTGSLVYTVTWTDTAADDRDSVVTVAAVAPQTPGCSATNGSYTVSATEGAAAARITDDPTVVALTSADARMREGDASDPATVTVGLARRLYGGEVIAVPLTLATTTGARLPGDATPDFTLHTVDPVAVEGSTTNTAGIEVRLSGALDTGRTLAVTVQTHTDIWDVGLDGSPAGVAYSRPATRQHRLVFTGPGAPTRARLVLAARASSVHGDGPRSRNPSVVALHADTVSGDGLQSRNHYVALHSATGYTGATVDTPKASRQFLQVIDSASTAGHGVTLQVSSEPLWRDGSRRRPEEGDTAVLIVSNTGGKPVSVTVAVQPVTADFDDLGRASEGGYLSADNRYPENATDYVGHLERDTEQGLDLYTVSILRHASVFMQIPIVDDGRREGPETFRAFIYRTPPGYKAGGALAGTRVSTVEFTIPASDGGLPLNAAAVEVPAAQVSNLEVAKVDATSASARWDAVAHATGYEVSWDVLDGNGLAVASGLHPGVTGTTETIEHNAPGAAKLTVTVTPEYVDGNGDTQTLADLAATVTLDLSTPQSAQADSLQAGAASCDLGTLRADIAGYIGEQPETSDHVKRWKRVLAAFDGKTGGMTAAEARTYAGRGWTRWDPVVEALDCLEKAAATPQAETPAAVPELSLAAGPAVDEGGSATFTVHADPAPAAELTVAFTVAQSGEYLDAPGAGSRQVALAAGAASATLTLATADDQANEADGWVGVTLDAGAGYTLAEGKAGGTVAVRDNDTPAVGIAAGSGVTEGAPAAFTLTANPVPHADLTVTLAVTQSGDHAAEGETGTREVVIPAGGSAAFEVATVNDSADEPDGSVTATVAAGTGYAVAAPPDDTASVAVADDDAEPGAPRLAIGDVRANEGDGFMWFTVTLSPASDRAVSVDYRTRESSPVSARRNSDFLQVDFGELTFSPGETSKRFWVYMFDDNHDEDPETFEVALSSPTGGARIAEGVAVGTIVNDDPMPAAWLARFGRTVAEQALDGIAGRIAAPREAGARGTIAGQALSFDPGSGSGAANDPGSQSGAGNAAIAGVEGAGPLALSGLDASAGRFGPAGFGHDAHGFAQSRTMTGLEALLGSSFTATGETDGTGGSLAFWGRAAQSSFDGQEGTFSLDGETTTAMLGADYARGNWLVGLALMQSSGEGGYADTGIEPRPASQACPEGVDEDLCNGAVRTGDGDVEASLTAAVPYAAIQASERLRLWGAAGFGTGEVTLKPAMGGSLKSDLSWTMAAAGARSDLLPPPKEGSGPTLALTADALWARTSSEKTHELAASDSDVTRLRLGLEGGYAIATEGGGRIVPRVEIGARHDGGDAETGFGVELGGGIAWTDPQIGLSLDLSGRTLIAHGSDDLEDRGFAASLAFDPNLSSERGLSLTLTQDWGGSAQGGLDALFATDPLADRTGIGEATSRWQAEAAYGLPAFSGRFTGSPHVGLGLATGARDYTLGWRLSPAANANAPDLSFGVKATRRESEGTVPEHTVGFEAIARW